MHVLRMSMHERTFFRASQFEDGADAGLEGGRDMGASAEVCESATSITVQQYVSEKMYGDGASVRRTVTLDIESVLPALYQM